MGSAIEIRLKLSFNSAAGTMEASQIVGSRVLQGANGAATFPAHPTTRTSIWPKATTLTKRKSKSRRRKSPSQHQRAVRAKALQRESSGSRIAPVFDRSRIVAIQANELFLRTGADSRNAMKFGV
jgi:hypothetical protein